MGQNNNNMPASAAAGTTGSHLKRVPTFFDKPLAQTGVFQTRSSCLLSCKFPCSTTPDPNESVVIRPLRSWGRAESEAGVWEQINIQQNVRDREATGPGFKKHLWFRKCQKIVRNTPTCHKLSDIQLARLKTQVKKNPKNEILTTVAAV